MEILAKFVKALFFTEEGEADKSAIKQLKQGLLWILLGAALCFGGLMYLGEDEDYEDDTEDVEYVIDAEDAE